MAWLITSLAVFALALLLDVVWVYWLGHVREGRPVLSGLGSGLIQLVSMGGTLLVVDNHAMLVMNVLGHTVGGYLGVKLKESKDNEDG